jgi:hypothetical protein
MVRARGEVQLGSRYSGGIIASCFGAVPDGESPEAADGDRCAGGVLHQPRGQVIGGYGRREGNTPGGIQPISCSRRCRSRPSGEKMSRKPRPGPVVAAVSCSSSRA